MPVSLSIKNVPDDVAERLKERARLNHRSVQGELLALLEEGVKPRRFPIEEVYERAKKLGLKSEDSTPWIREDRDAR